ncbi:phosphatidylglycerophosphatase A family protein [Crenobacter cavernae]|uniref:Phosphatidylglycerophosphatase A n=1 Tax=Crenobacter cavernae TaxID=2290923 RepID=A0ABY0FAS5_9NEIS|nr:phosphatidylglycerophosphatase A [Crenobacter cavernae]RXZ42754.1 phosphatidylglycerophosphatase A [Crenobacter cavernae]
MTTLPKPDFAFLTRHPAHFIAFGFGSGLAPRAPGTFGTLVALPLYALLAAAGLSAIQIAWLCVPLFVVGCWASAVACRALGVHDHGGIVIDEIVAMLAVLAFAPESIAGWGAAFVLFRLFDIAKPWPIRWLDARVHGGFGVMVDDALAALFAVVVLRLLVDVLPL